MAEVLTVNYDNNLTFNSIYSYLGVYNDKVYISTYDTIYEFDVYNKIVTPIYVKSSSLTGSIVGGGIYNGVIYLFRGGITVATTTGITSYVDTFNITTGIYSNVKTFIQKGAFLCKPWVVGDTIYTCGAVYNGFRTNIQQSDFYSFNMGTQVVTVNSGVRGVYCSYKNEQVIDGYFQYSVIGYYSTYDKLYYVTQKAYRLGMLRMVNNKSSVIIDNVSYQNTVSGVEYNPLSNSMLASGKFKRGNLLYMIGGTDENGEYFNTIRVFDTNAGLFSEIGSIGYNFYGRDVCEFNGNYYVLTNDGLIIISFIDYNLTFNVYSPDGSKNYLSIDGNSPITALTFNYTHDNKSVGYVFETLSGIVRGSFEIDVPEGKILLGFSPNKNSTRAPYPVNTTVNVSIYENYDFYAVFLTYRPPTTTFNIELYQNSAEVNRVDKGQHLAPVGTLLGALREECSMLTPSIVYQSESVPTFNYVYIPIFNRYYFVTSLSSVSKNVWRMELNCDVLMTYKNEILLLQGVIGRQEIDFNPLLVDNELPTQNNPIVEVIDIPSDAFNTQSTGLGHNFLLTVIGA